MSKSNPSLPLLRRFLLRLALGRSTYDYMRRSIQFDPRTSRAKSVDIVTRKDGREVRVEADWVKTIARIIAQSVQPYEQARSFDPRLDVGTPNRPPLLVTPTGYLDDRGGYGLDAEVEASSAAEDRFFEVFDESYLTDKVEAELRAAGADPGAIGKEGTETSARWHRIRLGLDERQDRDWVLLRKSRENGKWWAVNDRDTQLAHSHATAVECAAAAMQNPPREPRKHG